MMLRIKKRIVPFLVLAFIVTLVGFNGTFSDPAHARSRSGGRSFSRPTRPPAPPASPTQRTTSTPNSTSKPSFWKGLAGGLIGGAIGGMLFGALFGGHGMFGTGIGLLPILLILGIGFFIVRKMLHRSSPLAAGDGPAPVQPMGGIDDQGTVGPPPPPLMDAPGESVEEGLAAVQRADSRFDPDMFKEVALDVFFRVQASWIRRDLSSIRALVGDQLALEYQGHFDEMIQKGRINKLENISVRNTDIVAACVMDSELFVTVLFTANLLDYTVDDKSGELIEGSMTDPVKFTEKWTWAKKIGETNWLLEGIDLVSG
jgi:predicted lipid-binding transport protein (Tim44 family)